MIKREKLYKIGEVMHYSGLSRQTLHNYTLAGLIVEARRTESGHRLYDESVFDRLEKIKQLQEQHYTLMQIKKLLEKEANESNNN
ncbi:MAG: MerR family transcriptional regulator [Candidatus Omnitrophica bacterium]|nr:MerR family transcriptional regulator [Candidatus Omnitrophota bacterium]